MARLGAVGSETSSGALRLWPVEEQLPPGVLIMGEADPGSSNHQQHLGMSAQSTQAPGSVDSL